MVSDLQVMNLNQNNTKITTEAGDMAMRIDSLQRNLVLACEKETHALRDKAHVLEQFKHAKKASTDYRDALEKANQQLANKHNLLDGAITLNHQ